MSCVYTDFQYCEILFNSQKISIFATHLEMTNLPSCTPLCKTLFPCQKPRLEVSNFLYIQQHRIPLHIFLKPQLDSFVFPSSLSKSYNLHKTSQNVTISLNKTKAQLLQIVPLPGMFFRRNFHKCYLKRLEKLNKILVNFLEILYDELILHSQVSNFLTQRTR